ncbi:leucyl aminopeptidase family protein [Luteimonas abyssi]|uniref:leucyl aminopeptidase family protein n=1 Tax=Luteimonas abyssi TaxID=1247514 RepID=UPI0009EC1F74|nr:leucyl aminopeptidase family protein [Luteimonas abyssi]
MTDSTAPALPAGLVRAADAGAADTIRTLHVIERDGLAAWRAQQDARTCAWLDAHGFTSGGWIALPGDDGLAGALLVVTDMRDPYAWAPMPVALPPGDWRVHGADAVADACVLGWGLGAYRFTRYRGAGRAPARLVLDAPHTATLDVLAACNRVRDLVNTPTEDMGPDELEAVARDIATAHGATFDAVTGDALLAGNLPAIHAVGRASHRAPRLLQLDWGDTAHPKLVLVGKGVCFDTGGLDIKPADGMRNMKKDMGGAAHALALAELVMARKLPVRLTLLIPAVENAIGPNALRPGEVIATRKGIAVEIDNTDAEGRLVLGDALTLAGEQSPDLILDFATLTGAARIALGPDLPALYSNDDGVAERWLQCGLEQQDPVWRMPLWRPYLRYLTSRVADMANAGSRMAGSVTAALYLERFVPEGQAWAHLDVYSWNDADRPGKPAGGEAQGLRAVWAMLDARYR